MENLLQSIFNTTSNSISIQSFLACVFTALFNGVLLCILTKGKQRYNETFVISVALLPAAVCVIIMMVNGNLGASLSVAGAFSLVRFRSAQGNARQITTVLIAMTAGLIIGMGYLVLSVIYTLLLAGAMNILSAVMERTKNRQERFLYVTIPESLNYTDVLEPVLNEYVSEKELEHIRTVNMGSLFKLTYRITMKPDKNEKQMIDDLRCVNGNLEIHVAKSEPVETAGM